MWDDFLYDIVYWCRLIVWWVVTSESTASEKSYAQHQTA